VKIPPEDKNPAEVRTFDHRRLAALQEHGQASKAIDALADALGDAKINLSQREWFGILRDMAAALCFRDRCPECVETLAVPYLAVVEGDSVRAAYRCAPCDHAWTCSWATWAPLIRFADSRPAREETNGDAA
jgi:hypothetical protein